MAPMQITPNGNNGMAVAMNWNGFLGLISVTPTNGSGTSFGYGNYARKNIGISKDGTATYYN